MRLSYGYHFDGDQKHLVTQLVMGDKSRDQLLLQPGEVVFVEIRVKNWTAVNIENYQVLKICTLYQKEQPKSYKELEGN